MDGCPRHQITIPINESVDTSPILATIDHPTHRLSEHRKQLGFAHVAHPGATHTRFEHELGSYDLTRLLTEYWLREGSIDEQEATDIRLHALVHDDPHGPYSHLTDPLVSRDHNARGEPIIDEMADAIRSDGGDPERIKRMMNGQDPLGQANSHPLVGMEKLDYLVRDSHHTGLGMKLNVKQLISGIFFDKQRGKVVIDARVYEHVMLLLNLFWLMYDQVYYLDKVVIIERFMQRLIGMLLGRNQENPELTEDELLVMVDSQLDVCLQSANNPVVREHYQRYLSGEGPVPVLLLQPGLSHKINWTPGEPMVHLPADEEVFAEGMRRPPLLNDLERKIEGEFGLPQFSVLATPAAPKRRFVPPELLFLTNDGVMNWSDLDPLEWMASQAKAQRHNRFHVAVDREHRDKLGRQEAGEKLRALITECAKLEARASGRR